MIIAAFNPKGGVGKTTTAVNLCAVLARRGKTVLLVDLEADLNSSISLGVRPARARPSVADVLLRDATATDAIRSIAGVPNLHLMTGSPSLAHLDAALRNVREPERRLADVIRPLGAQFDAIVFDSPAGYSLLTTSVPAIAQHLIVPTRATYLSLESLAHFLRWYRDLRAAGRAPAGIAGILLTMVDRRQATREIVDIIRVHNRRGVLRTEIPQDPRVAEAPSHGVSLIDYAARSAAAVAYEQLAAELLKRLGARRH